MKFSTVIASAGLVSCLVSSAANASGMPQDHTRQLKKKSYRKSHKHKYGKYGKYGHKANIHNKGVTAKDDKVYATDAPAKDDKVYATDAPAKDDKVYATDAPAAINYHDGSESSDESDVYGSCTSDCAVDNKAYPKCSVPRVCPDDNLPEVSVCGDATYKLPASVAVADICSGHGDKPSGTICPMQGAETTVACRENIMSYLTGHQQGKTGTCVAPEAATCQKLLSGAWGCVFPGNCNTRNKCLGKEACSDEYKKDAHGKCVVGANHYPVPAANYTGEVNTTVAAELPIETTEYSTSSAATLAVSGMVGLVTVGTFVISMM